MQSWKNIKREQESLGYPNHIVFRIFCPFFPLPPLLLDALSQSSFLSFYSTFPPLTSSILMESESWELPVLGPASLPLAWSHFYANETLNKIRQSARAASPTQTLWWEGLPALPSVSIRSCGYLSFIHSLSDSVSLTVCKGFFSFLMALDTVEQCPSS